MKKVDKLDSDFADARLLDYSYDANKKNLEISFLYRDKKYVFYFIDCTKVEPSKFIEDLKKHIKLNLRDLLEIKEMASKDNKKEFSILFAHDYDIKIKCNDFYYES